MHALQGYSSLECVCVCPVWVFHTVANQPRTMNRLRTANVWTKMCVLSKPLRKAAEFASKLLDQLSAISFALASAQAYFRCWSWPRAALVAHFTIVFGASLYSARAYLHHWMLTSIMWYHSPKGRYVLSTVLHAPQEGISPVQCCN